jgi:hypothetical protein
VAAAGDDYDDGGGHITLLNYTVSEVTAYCVQ